MKPFTLRRRPPHDNILIPSPAPKYEQHLVLNYNLTKIKLSHTHTQNISLAKNRHTQNDKKSSACTHSLIFLHIKTRSNTETTKQNSSPSNTELETQQFSNTKRDTETHC